MSSEVRTRYLHVRRVRPVRRYHLKTSDLERLTLDQARHVKSLPRGRSETSPAWVNMRARSKHGRTGTAPKPPRFGAVQNYSAWAGPSSPAKWTPGGLRAPWDALELASMSLGFGDVLTAVDLRADAELLTGREPLRASGPPAGHDRPVRVGAPHGAVAASLDMTLRLAATTSSRRVWLSCSDAVSYRYQPEQSGSCLRPGGRRTRA